MTIDRIVIDIDMYICQFCLGEFPSDIFGGHYPFCVRPTVFEEGNGSNDVSRMERHEALIDDTVDFLECPICLERFPQDVLPVHASECGL